MVLGRYIGSTVIWSVLFSSAALMAIISLFVLLDEMSHLENNYQAREAVLFVLYTLPGRFYDMLPFGILIGCLAGLGGLANHSELIVMRTSGVSTYRISFEVMKPILVLLLFNLYLGEYIVPDMERMARNERERAASNLGKVSRFGFWLREGQSYLHVAWLNPGGMLEGITQYEFDDNQQMVRTFYAKRGVFHEQQGDESYWLLEDIDVTHISDEGTKVSHLPGLEWKTRVRPDLMANESIIDPVNLSLRELNRKIEYLTAQGLNTRRYELGYWKKVLQPLAVVGLVLIAISFIFGPLRESTMGVRIVSGMVAGILFKFVQDLMAPASLVFEFPPILAVILPILLCYGVGLYLFRRAA
ncbi:MAG: LPS export ABC transporter permease LptG [Gammaproteobacteria bacterium]|nr:LPS export ABC transporter permease LptG [Gammaproteobacteria bacterium]